MCLVPQVVVSIHWTLFQIRMVRNIFSNPLNLISTDSKLGEGLGQQESIIEDSEHCFELRNHDIWFKLV